MNSIHLVGNVGQTPSLRETNGGTPVANVTLATNNVYKDRDGNRQQTTEWHRLVVWGDGAKNFAEIVGKGDLVAVRGRLEYKLREIAGEKLKDAVIRVEEWHQLTARKAQPDAAAGYEAGEDLDEGVTLQTEVEADAGEADEPLATVPAALVPAEPAAADPQPTEPSAVAPAEEIRTEDAPVSRARRSKK